MNDLKYWYMRNRDSASGNRRPKMQRLARVNRRAHLKKAGWKRKWSNTAGEYRYHNGDLHYLSFEAAWEAQLEAENRAPSQEPRWDVHGLGQRLRTFRLDAQLSLRQMAPMVGVTASTLSRWEVDDDALSFEVIPRLCQALNITPNELFKWKE